MVTDLNEAKEARFSGSVGSTIAESTPVEPISPGRHELAFHMRRVGSAGVGTLLVDGDEVGRFETDRIFALMVSWSGLDVGFDRGTTVSGYNAPFEFTGILIKVQVDLDTDQLLDHAGASQIEIARD